MSGAGLPEGAAIGSIGGDAAESALKLCPQFAQDRAVDTFWEPQFGQSRGPSITDSPWLFG